MFPIGDDNPSRTPAVMTVLLIAVNVAVFLLVNVGHQPEEVRALFERWAYSTEEPISPRLISSMFLHAGWGHLLSNMWMLWIVGDNVEDKLGKGRYLLLYLLMGIVATWVYTFVARTSPPPDGLAAVQMPNLLVGASGAIFGVMGMYLVFFPNARIKVLIFFFLIQIAHIRAKWVLGVWLVLEVLRSVQAQGAAAGQVATTAHVGGALCGIFLGLMLKSRIGGGGEGDAWDVHTGFSSASIRGETDRLVDRPPRPGWFAPPEPIEQDLMGIERRIVDAVEGGRIREAIDLYPAYEAMDRERPLPAHVQIEIAHEFYEQQLVQDAIAAYRRYLETVNEGPDRGEAKFRIGVLYARSLGKPDQAVRWLAEAAKEHPDGAMRQFARDEIHRLGGG